MNSVKFVPNFGIYLPNYTTSHIRGNILHLYIRLICIGVLILGIYHLLF
jgi:hypothetical protein